MLGALLVVAFQIGTHRAEANDALLSINPGSINVGTQSPFTPFSKTFLVKNWTLAEKSTCFTVAEVVPGGWILSISPTTFCLAADESQTVTVSGTFPTNAGPFSTSIGIQDGSGFGYGFVFMNGSSLGSVGIYDVITITTAPSILTPGGVANCQASFTDFDGSPSYIVTPWDWSVELQATTGRVTWATGATGGGTSTSWGSTMPPTLPPANTWVRDENQDVVAYLSVQARDNDGFYHGDTRRIGLRVPPDQPVIGLEVLSPQSVRMGFSANGAQSYEAFYSLCSGPPYTGSGANEGISPVIVPTGNEVTLSNLPIEQYRMHFSVRARNLAGAGPYSNEVTVSNVGSTQVVCEPVVDPGVPVPALNGRWLACLAGLLVVLGLRGVWTVVREP